VAGWHANYRNSIKTWQQTQTAVCQLLFSRNKKKLLFFIYRPETKKKILNLCPHNMYIYIYKVLNNLSITGDAIRQRHIILITKCMGRNDGGREVARACRSYYIRQASVAINHPSRSHSFIFCHHRVKIWKSNISTRQVDEKRIRKYL